MDSANSQYARDFRFPTTDQMCRATTKGREAEPGVHSNRTLGGPGKFMRSSSHSEEHFSVPARISYQTSMADMPRSVAVEKMAPKESWISSHRKAFPETKLPSAVQLE